MTDKKFLHGGNIYEYPGAIDFSANLNPLGMPQELKDAAVRSVARAQHYPDPQCIRLRAKLATKMGLPMEYIMCTAGASDGIMRICQARRPKKALLLAPCFSGFEKGLASVNCKVQRYKLKPKNNFDVDKGILQSITKDIDIVMFSNPNNPTGRCVSPKLVWSMAERCEKVGALLVVDESFIAFTGESSIAPAVTRFGNLVVMNSYTKMFAMAGIRLGFLVCSNPKLNYKLDLVGADWAVSTAAQKVGLEALELDSFVRKTRMYVDRRRASLVQNLRDLGLTVIDGSANYLLVRAPRDISKDLLAHGMLVRSCADYHGLNERWFRIAVRNGAQNAMLIRAIQEVLNAS